MASPALKQGNRCSQLSNSSTSKVSMTTSQADENFVESKIFSWMRLFRFASLLCRAE
ncbi:uncharacterized protein LOC142227442 isoform X2 [Haematobia irritans]